MALYLVHCYLQEATPDDLAKLRGAAQATSKSLSARGEWVRLIHSTFVPSEAHIMYLFEAPRAALVRDVSELAKIPFTRIVEALEWDTTA